MKTTFTLLLLLSLAACQTLTMEKESKHMRPYSDHLKREVRLEYMKPEEVATAKEQAPFIYVPFGSIEWHGYHNVVGLDALKAHEQLVGLAMETGGVVYPPVYFGSGGGHLDWPSTYMVDKEPMIQLVTNLLQDFEKDGFRKAILISGHYPNRSRYLDAAIEAYRKAGGHMEVLAMIENRVPDVGGDHAAKFETSYMLYLHPQTVDMKRLNDEQYQDIGAPDQIINWMGKEYEGHPCYGLVGIDPRHHASSEIGRQNTERFITFLKQWLSETPQEKKEENR